MLFLKKQKPLYTWASSASRAARALNITNRCSGSKQDWVRYERRDGILLQPIKPRLTKRRTRCQILRFKLPFHLFRILCLFVPWGRNIKDAVYPFVIIAVGICGKLKLRHGFCESFRHFA